MENKYVVKTYSNSSSFDGFADGDSYLQQFTNCNFTNSIHYFENVVDYLLNPYQSLPWVELTLVTLMAYYSITRHYFQLIASLNF